MTVGIEGEEGVAKVHVGGGLRHLQSAAFPGGMQGVNGVCIIGHGRSNPTAVRNAVGRAREFVTTKVQDRIQAEILRYEQALQGVSP